MCLEETDDPLSESCHDSLSVCSNDSVESNYKDINKTLVKHRLFRQGEYVAFTINPPDKHQFFQNDKHLKNNSQNRKDEFENFTTNLLKNVLLRENALSKYLFVIEISKYGRYHIHGYGLISNPIALASNIGYIKFVRRYHIDIDSMDSVSTYHNYCMKDYELMKFKIYKK